MPEPRRAGAPFLILGLAFVAIGASTNRAFAAVGIAFLVIALVQMRRR